MPPSQLSKLSAVAAEYLRNHDELEAAREMFRGERVKVLDALGQTMRDEAGKLNQVVSGARSAEKTGSFDIDVEREYVTVRAGGEAAALALGHSAGLGAFLGHVGAQTLLWFHLKFTPGRIKKLELAALAKALWQRQGHRRGLVALLPRYGAGRRRARSGGARRERSRLASPVRHRGRVDCEAVGGVTAMRAACGARVEAKRAAAKVVLADQAFAAVSSAHEAVGMGGVGRAFWGGRDG